MPSSKFLHDVVHCGQSCLAKLKQVLWATDLHPEQPVASEYNTTERWQKQQLNPASCIDDIMSSRTARAQLRPADY